jgi:tape measure domain-containing protein
MAKQVSEILVKLGIQGFEGLDKLKSSFRELEKSIGPSNATIEKARRSIIEFGDASSRTEQVIRGQLEAFKGLRGQAEIGSSTYNKLTSNIAALEVELRGSTAAIDQQRESILRATAASERNAQALQQQVRALTELQRQTRPGSSAFAQLGKDIDNVKTKLTGLGSEAQQFSRALNAGFGATPEKLSSQIATLRRGLVELRFDSEKYLETLERIQLLSITQAGRTGRAEVIAGFQAFQSPVFRGGYADPSRLPGLPDTTAALEQQLSELGRELANVERGSARYVEVSNRMADIQRELRRELTGTAEAFRRLDAAQAGVERRADKIAGIQEYYRTQGPMAPGVGGFRDPATGAIIAAGARTPGRIRVEEAAYPTPIGPQAFPEAGRRAQESIQQAMNDVNRIYEDARIRRVELQSKYDQIQIDKMLEGLDLEGRVREKGFRDELAAFDRQLEARDRRRRRGITAGQAVQAAGAVISGGIFGGPEGLLGGLGGAIGGSLIPGLGTVGGAFAGAAVGAQIGMLRQQAGAIGEYVAQLNLAKTTLAQAASSQEEYNRLLQLARSVSSDYAVGLRPSIEGLAQVATAAAANNLTFKETEAIYRGIIASGVAFGKSQQDLDALIRATTQVLSKGKVSAEEMSGQIGERLPGAVAKFAASTGRTLPELSKAFEQGEVTIADFVKFASDQFEEYDDVAQLIAEGPEKAGVRLQIALDTAAENFGGFFQRTGSGLQDFLANMINWVNANSAQIKKYVTDWVNAGAAIFKVLSQIAGAFGRTMQRFYQLMQANPGVALGNAIRRGIFGAMGAGQPQFTPEQLFPEFVPPKFGGGTGVDLSGAGADSGDSRKAAREAEKAAREAQRAYEENLRNAMRLQDVGLRTLQLEELTTLERQRQELVRRDADRIEFAILDLKQKQFGIDIKQTHLNETRERLEDLRVQGLKQGLDVSKTAEEISRNQIEYKELQLEAEKTITEELQLQLQILESMGLTSQMRQAGRRAGLGVFEFGQAGGGGFGREQLYQPQEFMTPAAQRFQEMREQLKEMISLENQVYAGAMQIGEAFSSAFTETITGSKSAKQALADLMASIGKHFLDMAQQIITQQISMILYGTVMRALGLLGGSTAPNYSSIFSTGQAGFNPSVFTGPSLLNAKGNVYAANGIQPFAMGGIVTKPTFFKYADGGTFNNGVMGEAGPEAIMPLKRGADGKLGVAARLDGAMKRYRSTPGSAAAAAEGDAASLAAAGAATMEPIDVRYSVERINNVDYVTADQFQAGMAQAAQQGAIQGERRAMRTLTNSSAARGRLRI